MVTVLIDADERFPDYSIMEYFGKKVDMSQDDFDRCNKAAEEYDICQDILRKYYKKGNIK